MMDMKLPFGLRLCKKYFRKLENAKKKVVACYIENGTIIMGVNQKKTSSVGYRHGHRNFFIHAESACLSRIDDASNGTLYIYRENMHGEISLARPCLYCLSFLKEKNVRKIVYSTPDGFAKEKLIY